MTEKTADTISTRRDASLDPGLLPNFPIPSLAIPQIATIKMLGTEDPWLASLEHALETDTESPASAGLEETPR